MPLLTLSSEEGSAVFDGPEGMTEDQFPELAKQGLLRRYWLERPLAPTGITIAFGMLNPSTATHKDQDPTITRCQGFAVREKAARMIVVNKFGLVSPYPDDLLKSEDPVGPENESFIQKAIDQADIFIMAFGAPKKSILRKSWAIRRYLRAHGRGFKCLGTSKDGWPKHPLYLDATTPLVDWRFPQ